ncbi:MAG: tRNA (adenosine(37)-N6)-threonylcarbamoyltransferase complex ATPase subunit type 1 TsaE [Gammaproteobacteria bacterium]|nr:tRNA (adenosine(37)-N6)-threonylcarbamoyltransferase complex ATPase subunit type 1 TsaE [Gammaproteobacteria bacterium]
MRFFAADEAAMEEFGLRLAQATGGPGVIYLCGDLGTGKTTLVRNLLRGLGFRGKVKSPTYTLIEPYPLGELSVYHLDLYRLTSGEELEWIGIRDLMTGHELLLVEWPELGEGALPPPDLVIAIDHRGAGRQLDLRAASERGRQWLAALSDERRTGAG